MTVRKQMKNKLVFTFIYLALIPVAYAGGGCWATTDESRDQLDHFASQLQIVGYPLALFMLTWQGIKWSSSTSPQEKQNAKRGVIYVLIGVLMLYGGKDFILYVVCG